MAVSSPATHAPGAPDAASPAPASDELLTVQDAARLLNVTVSWVYEHSQDDAVDRLPVLKLGKYLRFDPRDLRAYLDAKRAAARWPRPRR